MEQRKNRLSVDPLHGSILKGMILFSLPLMAVYLLQVFFQMADTIVIGNFGSENAMSSIGVTSSMINLIVAMGLGLGTGVSVTIGRLYGEGKKDEITKIIQSLPLTGIIIGVILFLIAFPLAEPLLTLIDVPSYLMEDAVIYFRIYFLAVPFQLGFNFQSSAVNAKGDTIHPLIFQVSAGLINILLNLLFVIAFRWGVAGVAVATVISQFASFAGMTVYLMMQRDEQRLYLSRITAFKNLSSVFRLGFPASFSNVMLDISNVIIQSAINTFEAVAIAGNTAAGSVEGFMYIAFVGFGSAAVVYISQNYGARNFQRVKETFWKTTLTIILLGEAVGCTVYFVGRPVLSLYGISNEAIDSGMVRLFYMGLCFGLCGTMNVLNGCIKGLQYALIPMSISMLCAGVLRTIWVLIMKYTVHTLESIYIAYPLCWGLSTLLCVIAFIVLYSVRVREYQKSQTVTSEE